MVQLPVHVFCKKFKDFLIPSKIKRFLDSILERFRVKFEEKYGLCLKFYLRNIIRDLRFLYS
jgi:hypothetical protein